MRVIVKDMISAIGRSWGNQPSSIRGSIASVIMGSSDGQKDFA
jgi:hypothetical protein